MASMDSMGKTAAAGTSMGNDPRAFAAKFGRHGISRTEVHRWHERLDYEAGLLVPVPVIVTVPDRAGPALRKLADAIALLIGLRAASGGYAVTEPFTFARADPKSGEVGFAEAWSGLSNEQVRGGLRALKNCGAIENTGTTLGRAILWRIRDEAPW